MSKRSAKRTMSTWDWFDVIFTLDIYHSQKLVLLAYARFADKEGEAIYPSKNRIAFMTGFTRRYVRVLTQELVELGLLEVVDQRQGRATTYRLTVLDHKLCGDFDEWMDENAQ